MSWKPEVKVVGEDGFKANSLAFETEQEALESAKCLFLRWILVEEYRAVKSDEPVNYKHTELGDRPI
jgi:hypothetical protein